MRFELAEIEATAPEIPRRRPSSRPSASACATPRRCARPRPGALAALDGAAEDGDGGARGALARRRVGLRRGRRRRRASSTRSPSGCARRRSSSTTSRATCAVYLDALEADPERLRGGRGAPRGASTGSSESTAARVEAVLAHAERCRAEIERLDNAEELRGGARGTDRGRRGARGRSSRPSSPPGAATRPQRLGERVAAELAELAMDGARSRSRSSRIPDGFGPAGAETVELLSRPTRGCRSRRSSDAASGGELSRIMLALIGPRRPHRRPTLVFDEIDAGIGGNTARAVGERLRDARRRAPGDLHHPPAPGRVARRRPTSGSRSRRGGGDARATVERVAGDELVAEIVRMLGRRPRRRGGQHATRASCSRPPEPAYAGRVPR